MKKIRKRLRLVCSGKVMPRLKQKIRSKSKSEVAKCQPDISIIMYRRKTI